MSFIQNILIDAKFTTNIIKNSVEKCLQIVKISENKYLKNLPAVDKK